MTGYTVHTGSTTKFSEGWDRIFKSKAAKAGKSASSKSGKRTAAAKRKK